MQLELRESSMGGPERALPLLPPRRFLCVRDGSYYGSYYRGEKEPKHPKRLSEQSNIGIDLHTVRVNPRERPKERRRYNRIARLVCHHYSLSLGFTLLA